jgi:hypothetical protein
LFIGTIHQILSPAALIEAIRNNITFFFEKQIQKHLGYSSPAICFSPDEESGAIATVGFRIERFA